MCRRRPGRSRFDLDARTHDGSTCRPPSCSASSSSSRPCCRCSTPSPDGRLFDWEWIGLDNFRQFFREPALTKGLRNTIIYAVVTSGLKVVVRHSASPCSSRRPCCTSKGTVRSIIFFPVLVSTVAVGITFERLMHPSTGLINRALGVVGVDGPQWLTDPQHRTVVRRAGRRLAGRRARAVDLHRRHPVDPEGALRVGRRRRRRTRGLDSAM